MRKFNKTQVILYCLGIIVVIAAVLIVNGVFDDRIACSCLNLD